MSLSGADAAAASLAMAPDVLSLTLNSRNPGEGGFTAYPGWKGCEQPATQEDLVIAGALLGERWKVFEMFLTGQSVLPKELDTVSDGVSTWTIKSISDQQARNVFRVRALYATTP